MILTDEATREKHLQSGVWGTTTLDGIFRKAATADPDRLALVDPDDLPEWTSGSPQRLSYGEAETTVSHIAASFAHLGLAPDQVVATMLPHTAKTVLIMLGAWRAGLIVAPLPLTWRRRSIVPALEAIGAKALITVDRLEGEDIGTHLRDVAAEVFSIRNLLGVGDDLAEGITDLAQVMDDIGADASVTAPQRKENAADHIATLTFTATADGRIVPVPRSHNQWIAAGLMPFLETHLSSGATILSPFNGTGMAGIGGAMLPWLLSGGTLATHHFRSMAGFADHCAALSPDLVLCPGPIATSVAAALDGVEATGTLLAVWHGTHAGGGGAISGDRQVVDLTILDELAQVARRREGTDVPLPLRLGAQGAPSDADNALDLVELKAEKREDEDEDTRQLLHVRGPMAPAPQILRGREFVPTSADGFLETTILVDRPRPGTKATEPAGRAGRLVMVGGLPVGVDELDDAYAGHDAVRGSALYVARSGGLVPKFGLAVVPEHAAPFALDDMRGHADSAGLAGHAAPQTVTRAAALPRKRSGELDEQALQQTVRAS